MSSLFQRFQSIFKTIPFVLSLSGLAASATEPHTVFTLQAPNGEWVVRALTAAKVCPRVAWDQQEPVAMQIRAPQAVVPARTDAVQADSKPAIFDMTSCDAIWPHGVRTARIEGVVVPPPPQQINRIVIIADTGCRLKASENAFQECNDPVQWPFQKIALSASQLNADLVVHIGDIHYRESPCPAGRTGCAGATWGYGWDAWRDDFFKPAKPLLAAAPWLFVRGNHESCFRAGQGWFRFIDALPWTTTRSCDDPANDLQADFSDPFAVSLSKQAQFLVFDSSKSSGKAYAQQDPVFLKYAAQMKQVAQLTAAKPESFFINHHPLLAAAPVSDPLKFKAGGSAGLQSVFSVDEPQRLFPAGVTMAMHGHVHLFEAIGFKTAHPVSLVLGNSGSLNEGFAPAAIHSSDQVYRDAVVDHYASRSDYGFATLDRHEENGQENWLLTEYTSEGKPALECIINKGTIHCH